MSINGEAVDYVKQYCKEESPGFALWVDGKWGAGKTWLIRKTLTDESIAPIYVSLYGLTSTEQIDMEIYRQLHPLLSSKPAKLAGLLFKGLLSATLKADFQTETKEHLSVSASLPDFETNNKASFKNKILVFDDIERSHIPILRLLGYINHFVEHDGNRAILIGNTDEIDSKNQADQFIRTKEKLVGHVVTVLPDTESAVDIFSEEINSDYVQQTIHSNKPAIEEIVRLSGANNLRNLRHGFKLFERILDNLPIDIQGNSQIAGDLLRATLALSFEVRSGTLGIDNISPIDMLSFDRAVRATSQAPKETKNEIADFYSKYKPALPSTLVLQAGTWKTIFRGGIVPKVAVENDVRTSHYFPKQPEPWLQLWSFMSLEDSVFGTALATTESKLEKETIENIEEFAHTVNFFIQLPDQPTLSRISKTDAFKHAENIINKIPAEKLLAQRDSIDALAKGRGINGRGFSRAESPEFVAFVRSLLSQLEIVTEANRGREAREFLALLPTNHWEFLKALYLGNNSNSKYWDIPILKYINARDFVSTVMNLPADVRWSVNSIILERYEDTRRLNALLDEGPWIEEVVRELELEFSKRDGRLSSFFINLFKSNLIRIAADLSTLKQAGDTPTADSPQPVT